MNSDAQQWSDIFGTWLAHCHLVPSMVSMNSLIPVSFSQKYYTVLPFLHVKIFSCARCMVLSLLVEINVLALLLTLGRMRWLYAVLCKTNGNFKFLNILLAISKICKPRVILCLI